MKYSSYKKGSSALRRIINDEELEYSRHFAMFMFSIGERRRGHMRGIYNQKTNNVVAFINGKGNVFMRPNSIYFDKISETKNKVIKHPKLRDYRGSVPNHVKQAAYWNTLAQKGADNLIANKDKPNRVYLFTLTNDNGDVDTYFVNSRMQALLKDSRKKFPNTEYALKQGGGMVVEKDAVHKGTKVYWTVEDYSEIIAKNEREQRIREEVARLYLANIQTIAEDAIVTNSSMNPIQFTFTEDGVVTEGLINLSRIDLTYPRGVAVTDWLVPEMLHNIISFRENLGTLASRDIDELGEEQSHERNSMYRDFSQYTNNLWTTDSISTAQMRYYETATASVANTFYTAADTEFGDIGPGEVVHIPTIQSNDVVAPPVTGLTREQLENLPF